MKNICLLFVGIIVRRKSTHTTYKFVVRTFCEILLWSLFIFLYCLLVPKKKKRKKKKKERKKEKKKERKKEKRKRISMRSLTLDLVAPK